MWRTTVGNDNKVASSNDEWMLLSNTDNEKKREYSIPEEVMSVLPNILHVDKEGEHGDITRSGGLAVDF